MLCGSNSRVSDAAPARADPDFSISVPFFDALDVKKLKLLKSLFTQKTFSKNQVIVEAGAKLDSFHIIVAGSVKIGAVDGKAESKDTVPANCCILQVCVCAVEVSLQPWV